MSSTSVALREKRATIVHNARELTDKAAAESRDLTSEEKQTFERAMADVDKIGDEAARLERLETAERSLDATGGRRGQPLRGDGSDDHDMTAAAANRRMAFRQWLRTGEVREEIRGDGRRAAELRDTIVSTDAKGGFLVLPTEISTDIVRPLDDQVFVRRLCAAAGSISRVTQAKSLGIRKRATRMSDANWTTEVQAASEDTTGAYGRRDLTPNLVSKLAKISILTLMLSIDAEREVTDELVYKFGVTEEKAYLTGDGTAKPLGVFTADANGISTARDVPTATATAITGDDLVNLKFSLKSQYWKEAQWVLNRSVLKAIRKIKTSATGQAGEFQYVWQPGLTSGAPDTILDCPYNVSEYAPGTITTGLYTALLGNFRYYRIAELPDVAIQRLTERYAETNEVGFIGRRWLDGAPVLEEAFARLKQA